MNVGVTIGLIVMVSVYGVTHGVLVDVKVYSVVTVLFNAGDHVPEMPFTEVVGNAGIVSP